MSTAEQQKAPQNIPGIIPGPWTDVQCLDFCSVALRHVVIEGDLKLSDINDALRYMAEKYQAPSLITENPIVAESPYSEVRVKNIDEWIKTLENAKRYEWLRNVAFDTPRQDLVPRDRLGNLLIEGDLDGEIDRAMSSYPGEQEVEL
jgi:hypothetical protein